MRWTQHLKPQFTLILQLQGKIDQRVTWPDHICTCQVVQTTHYRLIMSNQDKTGCHGNHKQASFSTGVHNTQYRSYKTQYRSYNTQYRSYNNETHHSCHGHLASYSSRWGTMTTSLILGDWREHLVLFCSLPALQVYLIYVTHTYTENDSFSCTSK